MELGTLTNIFGV